MKKPILPNKNLHAVLIQMKSAPLKFDENIQRAFLLLNDSLRLKPDLIVLPELWSTGYHCEINKLKLFADKNIELLNDLSIFAKNNSVLLFAGTFVLYEKGKYYNRQIVFDKTGQIIAKYDKMHLFQAFGEKDLFDRGKAPIILNLSNNWKAGLLTCYDLRFPEVARFYFMNGCNLLIAPSQWPGIRNEHWRILIKARAIENQSFFLGCNVSAVPENNFLYGNSMIVDPWGDVVAESGQDDAIINSVLEPEKLNFAYTKLPIHEDIHPDFPCFF